MVCLGNICRSPLAEGILQQIISGKGLDAEVDSAGTSSWHVGENPDQRTVEIAEKYGIDVSRSTGRQFAISDYDAFDRIFVMDEDNRKDVLELARNENDKSKVELILNVSKPGSNMSVPDPYYGGDKGFDEMYHLLSEACERIADALETT